VPRHPLSAIPAARSLQRDPSQREWVGGQAGGDPNARGASIQTMAGSGPVGAGGAGPPGARAPGPDGDSAVANLSKHVKQAVSVAFVEAWRAGGRGAYVTDAAALAVRATELSAAARQPAITAASVQAWCDKVMPGRALGAAGSLTEKRMRVIAAAWEATSEPRAPVPDETTLARLAGVAFADAIAPWHTEKHWKTLQAGGAGAPAGAGGGAGAQKAPKAARAASAKPNKKAAAVAATADWIRPWNQRARRGDCSSRAAWLGFEIYSVT
jgi:hypothetical protein